MIIPKEYTKEQVISLMCLFGTVDYFEFIDFDVIDWLEWGAICRN